MDNFLYVSNIAKELNLGKATIKFILKRFKTWIPSEISNGQRVYPNQALTTIAIIQEKLDMGILPSQIEEQLNIMPTSEASSNSNGIQNNDIRLSQDGLQLLKSAFTDIGEQQQRIAKAHEKRADAEERKAAAIEKRADAEEKKALAMNNIANALQEMNKTRLTLDPATQQIAHQAISVITQDEQHTTTPSLDNKDDSSLPLADDEADTLSEEVTEDLVSDEPIQTLDDLSALILDSKENHDSDKAAEDCQELDNLASLIDETDTMDIQIDDLSQLLENDSTDTSSIISVEMDDLSLLIDASKNRKMPQEDLDDLSLLIDTDKTVLKMDDLSKLIDEKESAIGESATGESATKETNKPEIKIDISPDQDLGKYKAAIMKIIIGFKTDGMNAEDTTYILNKNGIKTLSGKPNWTQKAISQIYKFIESAT